MPIPANSGDMRFRVCFYLPVAVDAPGGTTNKWVKKFTRWAKIQPLKGSEEVLGQRLVGVQPVLIFVRYDSDTRKITPDFRAVEVESGEETVRYAIKSASDMERDRRFITILAESGVADGGN